MTVALVPDIDPAAEPVLVHSTKRVKLYHGDARLVLPTIKTEYAGLICTDPPYGVEFESNHRTETLGPIANDGADKADRDVVREILTECVRIVGQGRHLYVFGPTDVLDGLKVSRTVELIWDKGTMSGGDLTLPWGAEHEKITFAVSKWRHGGKAGNDNLAARLRAGSILRHNRPTGRKVRHPTEKPVGLLRELIESSSRPGDIVVDPFAGVGSTGVAALTAGRRAILCELDERWIDIAIERLVRAEDLYEQMRTC